MPKNSSLDVLRRWQAMDHELRSGKLFVAPFARRRKVSLKTVRRDLAVFRGLGQRMDRKYEREISEFYWEYQPGVECLFVGNLSIS
jgi:hypothetical protein